jgi:hypothetical protein
MTTSSKIKDAINKIIISMMDRVMDNVLVRDPFLPENHRCQKPLYWEKLAVVVATEMHGNCTKGKMVEGTIKSERLRRIQETLNKLEHAGRSSGGRVKPDWVTELAYILEGDGEEIPVTVVCDLYIESRATQKTYAFELKAPLPNSDQTKVSKEKMFKLLAMEQCTVNAAYYALPYNPYGAKENYAWSFPLRWFDMKNDSSVLIGSEFWDLIGGKGTYEAFITSVNALGAEYRDRIYREYLEIEPPEHSQPTILK